MEPLSSVTETTESTLENDTVDRRMNVMNNGGGGGGGRVAVRGRGRAGHGGQRGPNTRYVI